MDTFWEMLGYAALGAALTPVMLRLIYGFEMTRTCWKPKEMQK